MIDDLPQVAGVPVVADLPALAVEHSQLAGPVGGVEGLGHDLEPAVAVVVADDEAGKPVVRREYAPAADQGASGQELPPLDAFAVEAVEPALAGLVGLPPQGEEDLPVPVGVDVPHADDRQEVALVLVDDLEVGPVIGVGLEVVDLGVEAPELPPVLVLDDEDGAVDLETGGLAPDPDLPVKHESPGQDGHGPDPQDPGQAGLGGHPLAGSVPVRPGGLEGLPEPGVQLVPIGEDRGFAAAALGPVDGHAQVGLPAVAGPDVAPQVGGDVLPGAEEVGF